MPTDLIMLLGGSALLYLGADWLVQAAADLAKTWGVSSLVVGLTVVSWGTSAPELVVSLGASLTGHSAISLGNVYGSNIANIGLVLGLTTLIKPATVNGGLFRREVPILLLATLAAGPVLLNGQVDRHEGLVFLGGAVVFSWSAFKWAQSRPPGPPPPESAETESEDEAIRSKPVLWLFVGMGLLLLLSGGQLCVNGASGLARGLGVSERVIGLTMVALGTSLPELATSAIAASKGHSELAVGNVVGSNLFNILFILGSTALIAPVTGHLHEVRFDLIVMTVLTIALAASLRRARTIGRAEGAAYLASYAAFVIALRQW